MEPPDSTSYLRHPVHGSHFLSETDPSLPYGTVLTLRVATQRLRLLVAIMIGQSETQTLWPCGIIYVRVYLE